MGDLKSSGLLEQWSDATKADLTLSGTFGFAPASNKHLIASVKPFSAALAKGL